MVSSHALAQGRSFDARAACDRDAVYRDLVYSYLTGKRQTKSRHINLLTTGGNRVKINSASKTLSTFINKHTRTMTGAAVTLPFTAVKSYAKLSFELVGGKNTQLKVCQFAVKDSASWVSFKPSDLKAVYGRSLSRFGQSTAVTLRVGKKRPPRGYRTSTVLMVDVEGVHDLTRVRTLKNIRIKTSR